MTALVAFASGCAASTTGTSGQTSSTITAPSTSTTPSGSSTSPGETSASATVTPTSTLGPKGYGSLELGMSYTDALATGELGKSDPASVFPMAVKDHPKAAVCVTKTGGLMAIFADSTMQTPEGIHLGSTLSAVQAAYPNLKQATDYFYTPTSKTTRYVFLIAAKDKQVYQWNISTADQTCFN